MNYPPIKTTFVQRLVGHLTLGSMNQEAYFSLYKLITGYNKQKPFHEDTGELFSNKERKEFQKQNVCK